MILTYHCHFGQDLPLTLSERFGTSVEIEALEFVNAIPMEWRLVTAKGSITQWNPGMPERKTFAFHDLQRGNGYGTSGTPGRQAVLETRGIGDATVLIWLRDRTYKVPHAGTNANHIILLLIEIKGKDYGT